MSPERPATHPHGQDECAELLASRVQAFVDQIVGVSEMLRAGMAGQAFGDLATHLAKCAAMGQRALDNYAALHGAPCEQMFIASVIEFMDGVR